MVNFIKSSFGSVDIKKEEFKEDRIVINIPSEDEGFKPTMVYKFKNPEILQEVRDSFDVVEELKVLIIHGVVERILPENYFFPDWENIWRSVESVVPNGEGRNRWQIMESVEEGNETVVNIISIFSGRPTFLVSIYPMKDVIYFFIDDYKKAFPYGNFGRNFVFKKLIPEIQDVYNNKQQEYNTAIAKANIQAYKAFAEVVKEEVVIENFKNEKAFKSEKEFLEALERELNED